MAVSRDDNVDSTVSGDNQGNLVQGRDFHGPITFTSAATQAPGYLQDPRRWPVAGEWDALEAGAHRARPGDDGGVVPQYVLRDKDAVLRRQISRAAQRGGLVLIVGDSTAGKTRAAFEAVRAVLPQHRVLAPTSGSDLPPVMETVARFGAPCVVWLDNLENYLEPGGLDPALLAELVRLTTPVVATMRLEAYEIFSSQVRQVGADYGDIAGRRTALIGERVLNLTEPIELERLWTSTELDRADVCDDSRIIDALAHHGPYGIAEYLAAGPALWLEWRRSFRPGGHPRGAALVAAAVDLARTGLRAPYPLELLAELHEHHLAAAGGPLLRAEPLDEALDWAARLRHGTTSLLLPTSDAGAWKVFDYLIDHTDSPVPRLVWDTALAHAADDTDRYTIGFNAYPAARDIAETAWRPLADAGYPDAANGLGNLFSEAGKPLEAEEMYRRALASGKTAAAFNLGGLLAEAGRFEEAEEIYRRAVDDGHVYAAINLSVLLDDVGRASELPDVCRRVADAGGSDAAFNLGRLLAEEERLEEAEEMYRRAADDGVPEAARNLGRLLSVAGRLEEAEEVYRRAADAADPTAANNLGCMLADAGRTTEAEGMWRRAAGAGNVFAVMNLGILLDEMGRVNEAEEMYRRVLDGTGRTEEAEAMYRRAANNLGRLLTDSGRTEEAKILGNLAGDGSDITSPQDRAGQRRHWFLPDFLATRLSRSWSRVRSTKRSDA
jgi:tetratricopeptide (TPR) repeat protein